jgi:hypothetical protein
MRSKSLRTRGGGWMGWMLGAACGAVLWPVCPAMAQTSLPDTVAPMANTIPSPPGAAAASDQRGLSAAKPPTVAPPDPPEAKAVPVKDSPSPAKNLATANSAYKDDNVVQANCSSCGGGGLLGVSSGAFGGCNCGGGQCIPGRFNECSCCDSDTCCGRILCGIYNCICCPDPCYEPHWIPLADAAFFVDGARPVTQMKLRWDETFGISLPDRAEYFLAQEGTKGPPKSIRAMDLEQLSLYNEAAVGRFSAFVEVPYREVDLQAGPGVPNITGTGFADMTVGTKSLLLDCELLQMAFQFKTYIPIGSTGKGVSNGHVSLEPALLFGLKLAADTYLQAEVAYWIPIGGDSGFQSDVFHAHFSLNQILYRFLPDVQLIGTCEVSEWTVMNANATAGNTVVSGAGSTVNGGFGVRLNICDKVDFGVGSQFYLFGSRWEDDQFRAEFRWRF